MAALRQIRCAVLPMLALADTAPLRNRWLPWASALAIMAVACSDAETQQAVPVETSDPVSVEVVAGALEMPPPESEPDKTELDSQGYVVALGGHGSLTVVGTTVTSNAVVDSALEPLEVWVDDSTGPTQTGRVKAVLRRSDNVLIVAENGVFHTLGAQLVSSPVSDALAGVDVRSMVLAPTAHEEIWMTASDGAYQLSYGVAAEGETPVGELHKWTLDGTDAASLTSILPLGDLVLLAYGGALYELEVGAATAVLIDHDFGLIHDMTAGPGGVVHIATSQGLYERTGATDYMHYTLADGEGYEPVEAVVLEPTQGTFAVTTAGMLLARGGQAPEGVVTLPTPEAPRVLGANDIGMVWVGDSEKVYGMLLGAPISFAEDVAPLLETYCMSCHTTGTDNAPLVNFVDYATAVEYANAILQRVGTGQMPPFGNDPVPADAFETIKRWHEGGDNP